ncbi:hypothetical protein GCM10023189_27390 [Nibrella saemangeumensis]|uniref:Uncharacterized protein n=2 Tax=Nibrella saemangeumensis TaxID=1084526 RepID=A0ABP8MYR2_9BACT
MEAPIPFNPSWQDYQQWLDTLPNDEKIYFRGLGFEVCLAVNAFKRHWYEAHHYRLRDYLLRQLSREDFETYSQLPTVSQLRANWLQASGDSRRMGSAN